MATAGMTQIVANRHRRGMFAIDANQTSQSIVKKSRRKVSMNDDCSSGEPAGPSWFAVWARG